MHRTWLGLIGGAALALAACGGKVVIDADGSGGAGGTGGFTTNASSTASSGGGGGVDATSACKAFCEKAANVPGCPNIGCANECVTVHQAAGDCQDEFLDIITCGIEHAGVGGECVGVPCLSLFPPYEQCMDGSPPPPATCAPGGCSGGPDGSCSCSGVCGGNKVDAQCFAQPGGGTVCTCAVNGLDVGKCESPPDAFPCDIQIGCCAAYF